MDAFGIIQLFIPVVTFLMGYFLTDIGYRRDRKLNIIREKFDKLYHPFYVLVNELGSDNELGFAFESGDSAVLEPIIEHLTKSAYLATAEGQKLIWETRYHFISVSAEGETIDEEKDELFGKSLVVLFEHLIQEYMKSADALGYELISMGTISDPNETEKG